MGYKRHENDTRKDEEKRGREREKSTCMYLVKWRDRGYKNVEKNEQRLKRNGTHNSDEVR